jgi:hypothetical protein
MLKRSDNIKKQLQGFKDTIYKVYYMKQTSSFNRCIDLYGELSHNLNSNLTNHTERQLKNERRNAHFKTGKRAQKALY